MTTLQTSTPPHKPGLKYDAWLAKQRLASDVEIRAWVQKIASAGEKKKGRKAA